MRCRCAAETRRQQTSNSWVTLLVATCIFCKWAFDDQLHSRSPTPVQTPAHCVRCNWRSRVRRQKPCARLRGQGQGQGLRRAPMHDITRCCSSCCCCRTCCRLQPPCRAEAAKPTVERKDAVLSHDNRVGVKMSVGGKMGKDGGCKCDDTEEQSRNMCSSACISRSSPSVSTSTHCNYVKLCSVAAETSQCSPVVSRSAAQSERPAQILKSLRLLLSVSKV
jgi:hypothetical protein